MANLQVFISHADEDKILASAMKTAFVKYVGFDAFVAHMDITPFSPDFVDVIEDRIQRYTDLFVLLVSEHSKSSIYVNQEIGMALAHNKKVMPIRLDSETPFGFIDHTQGAKYNHSLTQEKATIQAVTEVFGAIISDPRYSLKRYKLGAIDSIISAIENSNDFWVTVPSVEALTIALGKIDITTKQLEKIESAITSNRCVRDEIYAVPKLKKMLKEKYNLSLA